MSLTEDVLFISAMTLAQTVLFGLIAGMTILIGMPLACVHRISKKQLTFFLAITIGILIVLLLDCMEHAIEPIEDALSDGQYLFALRAGITALVGLGIGLCSLVYYETTLHRAVQNNTPLAYAFSIAIGIGLHNLAEGLAIGSSAASGAQTLSLVLTIGFAVHNITEAFAVCGPIMNTRPSFKTLITLALIAGFPTPIGAVIGYSATWPLLSILLLTLASGAIMHVIIELFHMQQKAMDRLTNAIGITIGIGCAIGGELLLKTVS